MWGWEWREEGERAVRLSDSEKEKGNILKLTLGGA